MLESGILDVAIGLAFVFLLVSLLVSAAGEMASAMLKWRSEFLWEGIERLLQDADARDKLYQHPLIRGLARVPVPAPGTTAATADYKQGHHGPSYIPSRTFALALIHTLREPHAAADKAVAQLQRLTRDLKADPLHMVEQLGQAIDEITQQSTDQELKDRLARLKNRLFVPVDLTVVDRFKAQVNSVLTRLTPEERTKIAASVDEWLMQSPSANATYVDFRKAFDSAVNRLSMTGTSSELTRADLRLLLDGFVHGDPRTAAQAVKALAAEQAEVWISNASASLQGALRPLLEDAANDIDRFRENIEIWFNDGMDRVSGWYKRHTAIWHFGIALVLSVMLNVDALLITRTLWNQPSLRQAIVTQATATVENPPAADQRSPDQRYDDLRKQLNTLGLPIGWRLCESGIEATETELPFWCDFDWDDAAWSETSPNYVRRGLDVFEFSLYPLVRLDGLMMILGWLLTASATSLGAPFWFDLLKRFVSIRSVGKAPEERPLAPKEVSQPTEPGQTPREADLLGAMRRAR